MHPLQYIPTCEVAANICRDNPWCKQRLDIFRATCKFRDGKCRNPDSGVWVMVVRKHWCDGVTRETNDGDEELRAGL
ncbi:hypothetical protein Pcinc_038330 [Petrolisthes cinctipes]|uniref:GDNF/GAS1 domain-containing protein n=1 Tax=Petrolisthes cinctipes TaxID=88211 RepID=A0AAE1EN43_PETCI|nr:hypothetical protein Pcinc_038330 [Petrolisthes cinctipes]